MGFKILSFIDEFYSVSIGYICPISFDLLIDPVSIQCGHIFSLSSIKGYINSKESGTKTTDPLECPCCRQIFRRDSLRNLPQVQGMVDAYVQLLGVSAQSHKFYPGFNNVEATKEAMALLHSERDIYDKYMSKLRCPDKISDWSADVLVLEALVARSDSHLHFRLLLIQFYLKDNRYWDALRLGEECMQFDHVDRVFAMNMCGSVLQNRAVYSVAARYFEQVISILTTQEPEGQSYENYSKFAYKHLIECREAQGLNTSDLKRTFRKKYAPNPKS